MHELLEVRGLAAVVRLDHVVELGHHLAHLGAMSSGVISPERLLHPLERLVHDLLLQHVEQILELLRAPAGS